MKDARKDRVDAEVVLRPTDPQASMQQAARAESVNKVASNLEALNKVVSKLRDFGFEVTGQGSSSISIAGPRELFQRVFKTGADVRAEALSVPEEISNHVEGIYIQSPPTYFDS